jgi:hypothetical protein
MKVTKGRYRILEYPNIRSPRTYVVQVVTIYENQLLGRIVRYRYNFPLPIYHEALESEFKDWIVEEES